MSPAATFPLASYKSPGSEARTTKRLQRGGEFVDGRDHADEEGAELGVHRRRSVEAQGVDDLLQVVGVLCEERDILKRAMAFFARETR